ILLVKKESVSPVKLIGISLLALLPLIVFRLSLSGNSGGNPFLMLGYNFDSFIRGRDSILYLWISVGFLWLIGIYRALRGRIDNRPHGQLIRFAALFTAAGFISSTILLARMRESRLFLPAVIFLIPVALDYLDEALPRLKILWQRTNWPVGAVALLALVAVSIHLPKLLFPEFEFRTCQSAVYNYGAIHLGLSILFLISLFDPKAAPTAKKSE
ncbi:MAG: hypothetical protein P1R58_11780, partial [bacterium]|nr:hypothetical protein [bacterium]